MVEASVVQLGSAVRHTPLASLSLGSEVPLAISDEADANGLGNNGGNHPVLGGFVAGGELAWRAAGPTVEIIDPLNGVRKAAWTFGAIMHNAGAKVTNVCGVGPGVITHVAIAVDLGADRKPQGMVAVLSLHTSRIIRTFHFTYKVTSLCMVSGGEVSVDPGTLSQELQVAHGLLALGTHHGTLHLLDLALDCKELISDEVSPASIVQMSVPDPQAEAHRIQALKKRQHPSMCLSDGMVGGNQFCLIGPDENILYKTQSHLVTVTTLTYLPQLASLVVGYNFGSFQIINLSSIAVDCASPHEENMHPVHSFALQEPENDPKNFVYLWICRSYGLSDNPTSKSVIGRPALCTMYAMSYENKVWIEGHGLWYQHLSSISPRFEFEAIGGLGLNGQAAEPSRVFSAMTVRQATPVAASASSGAVALTNPDDESGPFPELSLCLFGWYGGILSSGKVQVQHYIAVFDINQWYQAHMPNNLNIEESTLCPYMSFHALDQIPGHITNKEAVLAAAPKPASWARHISKCNNDTDWFPASLSFSAHVLTSEGLMEYQCSSVQQAALSTISRAGPPVIVAPEQAYALASFAGLLPHNDHNNSPQNMTMMKERDALLNIALEMQQMCLLVQCVTEFAEGRYTHRGCSLPTLLDWTWNKVHQVKASVDALCGPLFDPSCGVISAEGIMTLHQNLTTLSSLTALTQAIKDNSNSITAQGASELENRVMVVSLVQQYLSVVLWFYHCGLLAHSPVEDMLLEEAQVPFPGELLARIYNNRRIELKRLSTTISGTEILLIDGLIEEEDLKSAGNSMQGKIGSLWEREGGANQLYPPPSLQALLAVFLLPCVQLYTKHRIVQYLFLDLASLLSDGYVRIVEELVKYPSSFSLSPSHIKLTQAFWLIDHKDFQEGLNVLLDPLVNTNDISPEQHRRIIKAFLYQGESSRALTYAQIRQPPKMDLDDIRLHLTLLLANGRVREAFHYQRTHRVRDNTKDLLHHLFTGCEQLGRLESVVHLPLSGLEEAELLSYLRTSTHSSAQDYLLVYYLQRARYSEAAILQEGLRNALGGVRKRHLARSSLLHAHITHLPDIAKKLATGSNDKTKPTRTIVQKPQPLSAQIRQSIVSPKSYSSKIARDMARVQGVRLTPNKSPGVMRNAYTPFRNNAQRRKYAGLDSEDQLDEFADMFNQTKSNASRDASHVVFPTLVDKLDMNRSSHQSRLVDDDYEYCSPAKRSRLSEVSLMREDTNRLMESVLKRSMSHTLDNSVTNTMNVDLLSLLTTPTVGKRPVPTSLSSINTELIDTPQSILKVRNFVKRPMSPSAASDTSQGPRFPRLPGTKKLISEDILKVPSATPSEASTTPKQIRFDLPGLTNGQSTILMVDDGEEDDDLTFNNEEVDDVPGEPCHINRSGQIPTSDSLSKSRSPSPRIAEATVSVPAILLLSETVGEYEDAHETLSDAHTKEISSIDEEDMEATENDICEESTGFVVEEETEKDDLENVDEATVNESGDKDLELIEQDEDYEKGHEVIEQESSSQENSMLNVSHIPTPRKPLHGEAQTIGGKVVEEEIVVSENNAVSSINGSSAGENDATIDESYYSIGDTENSKNVDDIESRDELNKAEVCQDMEQDGQEDGEDQDMDIQQISTKEIEVDESFNKFPQKTEVEQEGTKIMAEDVVDTTKKAIETVIEEVKVVATSKTVKKTVVEEVEIVEIESTQEVKEDEIVDPLITSHVSDVTKEQNKTIQDSVTGTQVQEDLNQTEELEQLIFSDSEEETEDNNKDKVSRRRSIRKSESSNATDAKLGKDESFKDTKRKSLNSSENIDSLVFSDSEESDNENETDSKIDTSDVDNISSIDKVEKDNKKARKSLNSSEYIPSIDFSDSEEEGEVPIAKKSLSKEIIQEEGITQKHDTPLKESAIQHEVQKTIEAEKEKVIEMDVEPSMLPDSEVFSSENKKADENEQTMPESASSTKNENKCDQVRSLTSIDIDTSIEKTVSDEEIVQQEITQPVSSLLDASEKDKLQKTEESQVETPKKNENVREMDRPLEEFISALQETPEKFLFREPEKVQEVHQSLTSAIDVQRGPEKFVFCEPEVVKDVRTSPRVYVEVYHDARNPDKMVIEVKKQLRMTPDRSPRRGTPDRSPRRNTPDRSPRRATPNRSPGRSTPNRSPGRATPDRATVNLFGEYQAQKNTSVYEQSMKIHQRTENIPVEEEPCVMKQVWKCGERESEMTIPPPKGFEDSICETKLEENVPVVEEICVKQTMWTCGKEDDKEKEVNAAKKGEIQNLKKSTEVSASLESQETQVLESMDIEKSKPEEKTLQSITDVSMDKSKEVVDETKGLEVKDTQASLEKTVEPTLAGQNTLDVPALRRSRRISESVDIDSTPSTPTRRSKRIGTPAGTPMQDKPSTPSVRTRRNSTTVVLETSSPAKAVTPRRSRRASINVEQPSGELGLVVGLVKSQDTPSKRVTRTSISLETASAANLLPSVEINQDIASTTNTPSTPSRRGRRSIINTGTPASTAEVQDNSALKTDTAKESSTETPATPSRIGRQANLSEEKESADVDSAPATHGRRTRRSSLSVEQPIADTEKTPATPNRGRRTRQSLDPAATSAISTITPSTTPARKGRTSLSVEVPLVHEEIRDLKDSGVTSSATSSPAITPSTPQRRSSRRSDISTPLTEGESLPSRTRSSRKHVETTPSGHSKTITPSQVEKYLAASEEVQQVTVNLDAALNTVKTISSAAPKSASSTPVSTPITTPITTPSKSRRKSLESPLTPVVTPSRRSKRLGPGSAAPTPGTPSILEAISEETSVNTSGELSSNVTPVGTPHGTPAVIKDLNTPAAPVEQSPLVSHTPTKTTPRKRHPSKSSTVVETLEPISEDAEIKGGSEATERVSTPEPSEKDALAEKEGNDTQTNRLRGRPRKSLPAGTNIIETESLPHDTKKDDADTTSMERVSMEKKPSESSPKKDKETEDTPPSRPLTLRRSEASVRLLSPSVEVKTWSKRKSTRLSMFSTTAGSENTIYKPRASIAAVKLPIEEESGIDFTPQQLPRSRSSRSVVHSDSFVLQKTRVHEESVSEQDDMDQSIAESETTFTDVIVEGGLDNDEIIEDEGEANTAEAESSPELSAKLLVSHLKPEESEQHRRLSRRRTSGFQGQSLRRKLLKRSIVAVKLPEDGPQLDETPEAPDTKSRRSMRKSLRSVDKSLRSVDSTIIQMKLPEESITEVPEEGGQEGSEPSCGSLNEDGSDLEKIEDKKAKDFVFSSPIVEGRRVRNQEIGKPPKRFSPSREDEEAVSKVVSTKRKR